MFRFCRTCGTFYNDKEGPCPKCEAKRILEEDPTAHGYNNAMSDTEQSKLRRKSWLQLIIGVPLFIGAIYLMTLLFKFFAR